MSVLVIGGSGFIGRYLVRHLLEDGSSSVVSMDVIPPPPKFAKLIEPYASRFRFVPGSASQLYDVTNAIKSFSVDKIVNLAFLLPPSSETNMSASISVNIVGNLNVFEAARLLGASRVVYASSIGLYGPQEEYGDREVTEEDSPHPTLIYGLGKQLAEKIAEKYSEQYGVSAISFRPGNILGHGRETGITAPMFSGLVSLPAVGKPVVLNVEGITEFCAVYVEDVAELIRILLEAPSPKYKIYNIGGYTITLAALADVVREFILDANIKFGHEPWSIPLPWRVSATKPKEEFNFCVRPFREAVLAHINCAREEAGLKPI